MTLADTPVRPPKAAEMIAGRLRAAIVSGQLAVGDDLPVERELIEAYGVSRPTLPRGPAHPGDREAASG